MSFSFTPVSDETSSDPSDSQSLSDLLLASFASFTTTVFKILSHPDNSFLINTPCHPLYHIEDELNPTSMTRKLSSIFLFLLVKTIISACFPFFSALSNPSMFPVFFLSVFQTVFSTYCHPTVPSPLENLKVSRDMLDFDPNQSINCDLIDDVVVEFLKKLTFINSLLLNGLKPTVINQIMPKLFNITVISINSSNCRDSSLIKSFTDNFLPLTDSFVYIQAESHVKTVDYVHVVGSKFVISLETSFDHCLFSPLRYILISKDLVKVFKGIDCELVDLFHYFFFQPEDVQNFVELHSILTENEQKTLSNTSEIDDLYYKCGLAKEKNFSEVNRIPYDSGFNFNPDYLKLIQQRAPLLSFLGDNDASMIPSLITVDTEPQYKTSFDVTVCPLISEFPKVEGVIVRFELPLEVMTPNVSTMLQYFNNLHNCFSVEITKIDDSFRVTFNCVNYHQLFILESLVNGDGFFRPEIRHLFTERKWKREISSFSFYLFKFFVKTYVPPTNRLIDWIHSIPSFSEILPNLNNWFFSKKSCVIKMVFHRTLLLQRALKHTSAGHCSVLVSQPPDFHSVDTTTVLSRLIKDTFPDLIRQCSVDDRKVMIQWDKIPFEDLRRKKAFIPINRLEFSLESLTHLASCYTTQFGELTKWKSQPFGHFHYLLIEMIQFCKVLYECLKKVSMDHETSRNNCKHFIDWILHHDSPIVDVIGESYSATSLVEQFSQMRPSPRSCPFRR
ncbi:hypothetical protein GEMRC1_005549 [Eukaryota sp. GEM-RC1]